MIENHAKTVRVIIGIQEPLRIDSEEFYYLFFWNLRRVFGKFSKTKSACIASLSRTDTPLLVRGLYLYIKNKAKDR